MNNLCWCGHPRERHGRFIKKYSGAGGVSWWDNSCSHCSCKEYESQEPKALEEWPCTMETDMCNHPQCKDACQACLGSGVIRNYKECQLEDEAKPQDEPKEKLEKRFKQITYSDKSFDEYRAAVLEFIFSLVGKQEPYAHPMTLQEIADSEYKNEPSPCHQESETATAVLIRGRAEEFGKMMAETHIILPRPKGMSIGEAIYSFSEWSERNIDGVPTDFTVQKHWSEFLKSLEK